MNRSGTAPVLMFDDFTFTGGSTIRNVAWQGIYCTEVLGAPAPAPVATSFNINIHSDSAGVPNTNAIYSATVALAQAGETFERNATVNCGTTSTTWAFYNYSTTLATPFTAAAGTRYWLSIVAVLPNTNVFWGWRNGVPDNNSSLQLFQGTFTTFNLDRAYSLAP